MNTLLITERYFMDDMIYYAKAAAYIGSALAIGLGTISPALAQGNVGARACENMGKFPESAEAIRSSMLAAIVFIETSAIYALMIAGAILFIGGR
jgi:F-type H+-transporting ATPase subunit c